MSCQEFEEILPLLLYQELSGEDRKACEAHLETCAPCRAALKRTERLHQVLAERLPPEPSAALLAESRHALDLALDREQHGWRALWHGGFPRLRLQPASGFALGLTLLLCGFGLGWELRPHAAQLASAPAGVSTAGVASPDLDNLRINGISRIAPDPQTGGVKITMDAERRVTLEGSLEDPKIQQVLVYAMKNYGNPGIRRDTLDALRSHTDNPNIRQALLYAIRHDSNPGVRLEALEALSGSDNGADVQRTLLEALEHDANPGVRVAAVDTLLEHAEKQGCDISTTQALRQLASTDRNPYVRLKCANAMVTLGK